MDKYNVINRIDNLSDLEQDMFEWSRLPMKFKFMSDDACIKQHGMKNIQYYELIKTKLLSGAPASDLYDDTITESANILNKVFGDRENYQDKLDMSLQLQQSPYIIILDIPDGDDRENLLSKYNKYLTLPPKYRRWSDYYSKDIYGFTVPEMYHYMMHNFDDSDFTAADYADASQSLSWYVDKAKCENNIIDLLTYKSLNYVSLDESHQWIDDTEHMFREGLDFDFDSIFNTVTPFFTPDEYNSLFKENALEGLEYNEWKVALEVALKEGDEQKIIDLGWNPSVPFNEQSKEYARERQIAWFKDHAPKIVDITRIEDQLVYPLEESSVFMEDLYREKNLYPVYIVMSYSDTLFGKLERAIKKVEYSHAGLCFDSSLKEIFTYSFGKDYNGFVTDSLKTYISNSKQATMSIICIFVDKDTRDSMYNTINYLQDNKERTKYGFGNIINILMNRAKKFPYPENLVMVCSQFVDMMLKLVNIDITHKSSNLVIPQDFHKVKNNPAVYKVYEGLCTKYKEDELERRIKLLFVKGGPQNIKYPNNLNIEFVKESDEIAYNTIMKEIRELLTPTSIIEATLPFRFNKQGELEINLYQSLEDQYQESHKLLLSYNEDNIEGIKKELAHMFYINSKIEKKIRKMKKSDDEYKQFIDLRARVINDFKTYFKLVGQIEKDFDFSEYYQHSDYNMNVVKIDNPTLKYSGKTIKKVLGTILRFKK